MYENSSIATMASRGTGTAGGQQRMTRSSCYGMSDADTAPRNTALATAAAPAVSAVQLRRPLGVPTGTYASSSLLDFENTATSSLKLQIRT